MEALILTRLVELFPHLVIVVAFYICALFIGISFLFRIFKIKVLGLIEILSGVILGLIFLSAYYYILGLLSLYKSFWIVYLPVLICLLLAPLYFAPLTFLLKSPVSYKKLVIFGLALSLLIVLNIFPDIEFDSNWYHLSLPQFYINATRIYPVGGYIFPSGFPQFMEMLFIPLLKLGNSVTTTLFSFVLYVGLITGSYLLAQSLKLTRSYSLLAAFLVATVPVITKYSVAAYVDIPQAFFMVISFLWLQRFIAEKQPKHLLLAGITFAPAAAIKYAGGFWLVPLILYYIVSNLKTIKTTWVKVLYLVLPSVVLLSMWLVRNYLQVGYLFHPIGVYPLSMYGAKSNSYIDFVLMSFADTSRIFSQLHTTGYEYAIPFALVLSLFGLLYYRKIKYLVFILSGIFIWRLLPPGNDFRYLIPLIPFICVFCVYVISLVKTRVYGILLFVLFFILALIQYIPRIKTYYINIPYIAGIKNIRDFEDYYFTKEPYMVWDTTDTLSDTLGDDPAVIMGSDLIYPVMNKYNVIDYTHTTINPLEVYSFKTLHRQMTLNRYKYFLTNRKTLQDSFSVWFVETSDDPVSAYFDLVLSSSDPFTKRWYLYKIR